MDEFHLQYKNFQDNACTYWQKLRNQEYFSDVTLACSENIVKAHKIVLSANSTILENILINNPHQNPVIYLHGVKYSLLLNLLDFLYTGEVSIEQEQLKDFLTIATELRIKGIDDEVKGIENIEEVSQMESTKQISLLSHYNEDKVNVQVKTKDEISYSNEKSFENSTKFIKNISECDNLELMQSHTNTEDNNAQNENSNDNLEDNIEDKTISPKNPVENICAK